MSALSAPSFLLRPGSAFDFSMQTGTRAAVTAAVDRSMATRSDVPPVDHRYPYMDAE